jgi:protein disulfide-isomerase
MSQQSGRLPQSPSMQQAVAQPAGGNPPLALDGFCPVSLERTMRLDQQPKWVQGDPRWGILHEGRTYLFAGPEEQQIFYSNPYFYAPVLSGNDAVLQVEQGLQTPGAREFGARWRDRVYLFSCRENYDKFRANPTFYENEIIGSQQVVARPAQVPGQPVGAANAPYGYR